MRQALVKGPRRADRASVRWGLFAPRPPPARSNPAPARAHASSTSVPHPPRPTQPNPASPTRQISQICASDCTSYLEALHCAKLLFINEPVRARTHQAQPSKPISVPHPPNSCRTRIARIPRQPRDRRGSHKHVDLGVRLHARETCYHGGENEACARARSFAWTAGDLTSFSPPRLKQSAARHVVPSRFTPPTAR